MGERKVLFLHGNSAFCAEKMLRRGKTKENNLWQSITIWENGVKMKRCFI